MGNYPLLELMDGLIGGPGQGHCGGYLFDSGHLWRWQTCGGILRFLDSRLHNLGKWICHLHQSFQPCNLPGIKGKCVRPRRSLGYGSEEALLASSDLPPATRSWRWACQAYSAHAA